MSIEHHRNGYGLGGFTSMHSGQGVWHQHIGWDFSTKAESERTEDLRDAAARTDAAAWDGASGTVGSTPQVRAMKIGERRTAGSVQIDAVVPLGAAGDWAWVGRPGAFS